MSENTYEFQYDVKGTIRITGRTAEDTQNIMCEQEFGDLYDAEWKAVDLEHTMDGYRNDRVAVTYEVNGIVDIFVAKAESYEAAKEQADELVTQSDLGELEDAEFSFHDEKEEEIER